MISKASTNDNRTRFSAVLTNTQKPLPENLTRSDNLAFCAVGDIVHIEYNGPAMRYFVYSTSGKEIGELGVPAFDALIEKRISKTNGIITALDKQKNGTIKVRISVNCVSKKSGDVKT